MSPYLERPLFPLAEALPRMLAKIEAEPSTATGPTEEQWLRQRSTAGLPEEADPLWRSEVRAPGRVCSTGPDRRHAWAAHGPTAPNRPIGRPIGRIA